MSTIILPVQTMTITDTETGKQEQTKIYTLPDNMTAKQWDAILTQLTKK